MAEVDLGPRTACWSSWGKGWSLLLLVPNKGHTPCWISPPLQENKTNGHFAPEKSRETLTQSILSHHDQGSQLPTRTKIVIKLEGRHAALDGGVSPRQSHLHHTVADCCNVKKGRVDHVFVLRFALCYQNSDKRFTPFGGLLLCSYEPAPHVPFPYFQPRRWIVPQEKHPRLGAEVHVSAPQRGEFQTTFREGTKSKRECQTVT